MIITYTIYIASQPLLYMLHSYEYIYMYTHTVTICILGGGIKEGGKKNKSITATTGTFTIQKSFKLKSYS